MINFKNKNILITGASGGIGNELVKKFVSLGGNVLGTGTNTEKLDFLKKFTSVNVDEKKLNTVIRTTDFNTLKLKEEQFGFEESIMSKKSNKKIKFFNLGKDNNWKKLLDPKTEKKITESFRLEMKELNYIVN